MKSNTIHVAYALDDRFAEMTCVSIASVLMNTTNQVMFHIIESRLSEVHITNIKHLIDEYSHGAYKFYHTYIDGDTYITAAVTKVTKETYAKAMLPDLLPGLDRVIWLDGDTIAEGDLTQLWVIDFDGCCAAMVPDVFGPPREPKKAVLGISDYYFNTGVILLDLPKLRELKLASLVESNLPAVHKSVLNADLPWYAEQDMINYILKGNIKKLPLRFNSSIWESEVDGYTITDVSDAFEQPVIIHFLGITKPTQFTRYLFNNPQWYRYYHYKSFTPYADAGDEALIELYRVRRKCLMDSLLLPDTAHFRLLIQYLKKELFEQAYADIIDKIGNRELIIWGYNDVTALLVGFLTGKGLTVAAVVDGISVNWDCYVFEKQVKSTDILHGKSGKYYILLDMRSKSAADEAIEMLKNYGYNEDSFQYVYNCFFTD